MMKSKIIKISGEFDEYLNNEIKKLIEDCKTLGISPRKIQKTKATKLLAKRLMQNDEINLKIL